MAVRTTKMTESCRVNWLSQSALARSRRSLDQGRGVNVGAQTQRSVGRARGLVGCMPLARSITGWLVWVMYVCIYIYGGYILSIRSDVVDAV
jgi:hypothetical protein